MNVSFLIRFVLTACLAGLLNGRAACSQSIEEPAVLAPPGATELFQLPTPVQELPEPTDAEAAALEAVEVTPEPEAVWYQSSYWFGPAPWDIGFELGLNGAEGNNESLSLRTGGHVKRKTEFWKFDTSLVYNRNSANNVETQNNALLDVRVDRLLGESPWTLYFLNQELYDEFKAFDLRVSLNAGIGYQFVDTETIDLLGRFGAGASREIGGVDERWAQEALFGMDYEHKLSTTQKLTAKVDYYPEWKDFKKYRVVSDVGWMIDLDKPRNLSLKLSMQNRYDSTPNGAEPHELNYAALLIWSL
ncbi:MAG: DUF481 domain-containing protein [Planctomycetales bacterium]|nr:DUF481 domain-containing protein [Planctomycetales bacterium]